MKRIAALVSVLALLALPHAALAGDVYFFNGVAFSDLPSNGIGNPAYVETGAYWKCDCKIDGPFTGDVYWESSADNANWTTMYHVANPTLNDPNNYVVAACPKYLRGRTANPTAGSITMKMTYVK